MPLSAAVLAVNLYHPAQGSSTPLDVVLIVIGSIVVLTLMIVPAAMARSAEVRSLRDRDEPGSGPATD